MLAFCIESSHARGMGHLYRSLNLADRLRINGYESIFYMNEHSVSNSIVAGRGYAYSLADLADCETAWEEDLVRRDSVRLWINDRLDTDKRHTLRLKKIGIPLVHFDDYGSGADFCDLHIAALSFDDEKRLGGSKVLRGIEYMILNPDIIKYRRLRTELKSIIITLGGSDTYGVTLDVVGHLAQLRNVSVTVILGPSFQHMHELLSLLSPQFKIKVAVPSLIREMSYHDLAVTGGGLTPFEAAASGLPCIIIANEIFEIPIGRKLANLGCAVFAGYYQNLDIASFNIDFASIESMSRTALNEIPLTGIDIVASEIAGLLL